MSGEKTEKSYAEKMKECKELSKEIQKDTKNWTKLTGNNNCHLIEQYYMEKLIRDGKQNELKFKCIIYPNNQDGGYNDNRKQLPCGLMENIDFMEWYNDKRWLSKDEIVLCIVNDGKKIKISHNSAGGYGGGYSKKYTKANAWGHITEIEQHDIDLFLNIPVKKIEELSDIHFGRNKK